MAHAHLKEAMPPDKGDRCLLHRIDDIVHVLAAGAWIVALVPFLYVMRAAAIAEQRQSAIAALHRFSTLGHVAVSIVLGSGVANTFLIVGHLPTDWHSAYQIKLLLKMGLVIAMTLLAVINRYVFVPRLQARNGRALRARKWSRLRDRSRRRRNRPRGGLRNARSGLMQKNLRPAE